VEMLFYHGARPALLQQQHMCYTKFQAVPLHCMFTG
jgi:hypothetical protein